MTKGAFIPTQISELMHRATTVGKACGKYYCLADVDAKLPKTCTIITWKSLLFQSFSVLAREAQGFDLVLSVSFLSDTLT